MTLPMPPAPAGWPPPNWRPPGPVVDPKELRPARWWYWIVGALGLVGAVGGAITLVQGLASFLQFADVEELTVGESARIELDPTEPMTIYALERTDGTVPLINCAGFPVSEGSIDLNASDLDSYVFNGRGSWRSMYDIEVTEAAPYRLECDAMVVPEPGDRVGLARTGMPTAAIGWFGVAALFGFVGLGGSIVIGLVVGIRRSNHRRRLLAERRPPTPRWPPPGWSPPFEPVRPPTPPSPTDFVPPG